MLTWSLLLPLRHILNMVLNLLVVNIQHGFLNLVVLHGRAIFLSQFIAIMRIGDLQPSLNSGGLSAPVLRNVSISLQFKYTFLINMIFMKW